MPVPWKRADQPTQLTSAQHDENVTYFDTTKLPTSAILNNDLNDDALDPSETQPPSEAAVHGGLAAKVAIGATVELRTSNSAAPAPGEIMMLPVFETDSVPLVDGVPLFLANGRFNVLTPTQYGEKLYPGGLVQKLDAMQMQIDALASGAGAPPQPNDTLDWDLLVPGTSGDLNVKVLRTVPAGVTSIEWEKNATGTWTALASMTVGDHIVGGFVNDVPQSVRIRYKIGATPGAPSSAKTKTPIVPAIAPFLATNTGGAMITHPSNIYTDSKLATIAWHGMIKSAALSGLQSIFENNQSAASARVLFQHNYTAGDCYIKFQTSAPVVAGALAVLLTRDVTHTLALSIDWNGTPTILVEVDGVALLNTGDVNTGYKINTPFVADATIDWAVGGGATLTRIASAASVAVGGIYIDHHRARAPSLFCGPSGLTDWNTVADGTETLCLFNRTLGQWNAADASNVGYATLTNVGSFT